MSAGGHCHGDPTLPLQPASRPGLLSSGIVCYRFRLVKYSLVLDDLIQAYTETLKNFKTTQLKLNSDSFIDFCFSLKIRSCCFILCLVDVLSEITASPNVT